MTDDHIGPYERDDSKVTIFFKTFIDKLFNKLFTTGTGALDFAKPEFAQGILTADADRQRKDYTDHFSICYTG